MCLTSKKVIIRLIEEVEYIISNNNAILEISVYWNKIEDDSFYTYAKMSLYWDSINRSSKVLDNHRDSKAFWFLYQKKQKLIDDYISINELKFEDIDNYTKKFKTIRDKHLCHIDKKSINNPDEIFLSADIHPGPFNKFIKQFLELLIYLYEREIKTVYSPKIYDAKDLKQVLQVTYPK